MDDHILVLGAGGFVGRHLVRALAQRGEKVIAASRRPVHFELSSVQSIVGELSESADFMPLVARSRAVVHLASRSTPGSSAGNAMAELQNNLRPTLALLQALQDKPQTNLLYLSSGGSLYATTDDAAAETAPVLPRSYHGATKIAAEHFIAAWCLQYGSAATIVRPSNIYGPGQTERTGFGIIPTVLGKTIRSEPVTVWGDGSAVRDYLYIDDFVALCTSILATPMTVGTCMLNAASGVGVSLHDLLLAIEAVTGKPLRRIHDASRAVDATRVVVDPTLANRRYGWAPTTSLREGLRQTWNWFNTTRD